MKLPTFSQRMVTDRNFSKRRPGRDDFRDVVQFQLPDTVMRLFRDEGRRRGTTINTLIRDVARAVLIERTQAILGDSAPAPVIPARESHSL